MRFGLSQIWRWPAALAVLMVFGLLSALLGQGGIWWVLSWVALAVPLAVGLGDAVAGRHEGRSWVVLCGRAMSASPRLRASDSASVCS